MCTCIHFDYHYHSIKLDKHSFLWTAISYTDEDGHELTYTLGKDLLTYDDARRRCHTHGRGDLATIDNEREQDFITNNVILDPAEYWIGFDDRDNEGDFEWVDR